MMSLFGRRRRGVADPNCREAVELVTAYLEDGLPAAQRAALERHLAGCPHCVEYFAQIRLGIEAAGRIEPEELAPQARADLTGLYSRWLADPDGGARDGVDGDADGGSGGGDRTD